MSKNAHSVNTKGLLYDWTGKKFRVWGKTYVQGFVSQENAWMENHLFVI